MLAFHDVRPEHRELITRYTWASQRRNCDLSFSNLCCWQFLYGTQFAMADGWLFVRFWVEGKPIHVLPVGDGDLRQAISLIADDARQLGHRLRIGSVCDDMVPEVEGLMPGRFTFLYNRDISDYVYLRSALATLTGKKLQAKRNHVNRFRHDHPDYQYVAITPDVVPECLAVEEEWWAAAPEHRLQSTAYERQSLTYALTHFDKIGLTGGLIRVGGRPVAFTFGMPISGDTFGVHVEKADTTVPGAFAVINQEFANRLPERYTYVNREEDLGIPGLRQAKMSYHPEILLAKNIAVANEL